MSHGYHTPRLHIILSFSDPVRQVLHLFPLRKLRLREGKRLRSHSEEVVERNPLPGLSALRCQLQGGYRRAENCVLIAQGVRGSPQTLHHSTPSLPLQREARQFGVSLYHRP